MSKHSSKKSKSEKTLAFSLSKEDFQWQYFRVGGNGGQKVNKTSSGVRVIHEPSGARAESRNGRSQLQNRREALEKLKDTPLFKGWVALKLSDGPTPEERTEKDMTPSNLRVEVQEDGKWVNEEIV